MIVAYIMGVAIALAVVIFLTYNFVPNLLARNFVPSVQKKVNPLGPSLALSFDDGPNPEYTPELLNLLARHDIKASFFVVAENARQHPELIKRMQAEGHTIGLHSTSHESQWLSSPGKTRRDFEQMMKIAEELGLRINLYRPPWGTFNLLTRRQARTYELNTVLWSLTPGDWRKNATPDRICRRIVKRARPGDIVLLHDNRGAPGAPANTIKALSAAIPALKSKGYRFVTVDEARR